METSGADSTNETVHLYQNEVQELTNIFVSRRLSLNRIALRRLGNSADAEDAVQDAFLSAYAHLDQFRGKAQMFTWLTTIVINCALMRARRRAHQPQVSLDEEDLAQRPHCFSERLADGHPTPEELCCRWELLHRLRLLWTCLSPTLRTTFRLRDVDGLSIRETAQLLGVPRGTVKARVARARAALKELGEKHLQKKTGVRSCTISLPPKRTCVASSGASMLD